MSRVLWLLFCAAAWAGDEAPGWVRTAAAQSHAGYPGRVQAVILLSEETLAVDNSGKRVMTERGVIKRLTSDAFRVAGSRHFDTRSGKIREMRAWVVNPGGKEVRLGKDRIVESSVADGDAYSEYKVRSIGAGEEVLPGGVFAYEIVEEEQTVFTTYPFRFQQTLWPVVEARFTLQLPAGWEATGLVFNHAAVVPSVVNNSYTWELQNLPAREAEPHMPPYANILPWIGVTYFPSGGSGALRKLERWSSVSKWMSELTDRQSEVTPAVQARADQLTAGAVSELDKIRAIAAFVQKTTYVSVQLNLSRGGGYVPNRADTVLTRNYGDCKDKANLMKALLKAKGIESYLVSIMSGAPGTVREEWPSTQQFNHAILAVKVSPETKAPTVVGVEGLGNLLFFDATDSYTPVGDLPDDEQGTLALVIAGEQGALVRAPKLAVGSSRAESETRARMNPEGGIEASTVRRLHGQRATSLRGATREIAVNDLRKRFEASLTRRLGGLQLRTIRPEDRPGEGRLDLTLEYAALQFGRIMQGRLLVVTPGALVSTATYSLPNKARTLPVRVEADVQKDSVTIDTPAGFTLDEMPEAVAIESPYGIYRADWKMKGQTIEFTQTLELKEALAPPGDYDKVRDFFERVNGASLATVVLVKK
ncbi:MAG: DUF3857 domain-containing protein [Acidobacteriota bacterium]